VKLLFVLTGLLLFASRAAHLSAQRADSLGSVRIAVIEAVQDGTPPTLQLELASLRDYGCSNFRINASPHQQGDTLSLVLRGLLREDLCDDAVGPAHAYVPVRLAPGKYILEIRNAVVTDRYRLEISTAHAQLRPIGVAAQVTRIDSTVLWRRPVRSFAFYCGSDFAAKLCVDLRDWIERQPGVHPLTFRRGGRNPYAFAGVTDYVDQRYYWYERDATITTLRACIADIARRVKATVGVTIRIATATNGEFQAFSYRSFHEAHTPLPERVTGSSDC
jgi:hypothetical protein